MSRVVVLGSIMQDLVVRVARLPHEGETVFARSLTMFTGGKGGNQAIAAARLGAGHVAMMGCVGDDAFADTILRELIQSGVDTTHVSRDSSAGTGIAIPIVLDNGQNSILSVPRANLAMSAARVEAARAVIEQADVLVMQFEVSWEAILAGARIACAAGVPILLNAAPASDPPPGLIPTASWLVVNEAEADALISETDRPTQAEQLRALGPATVTITLGAAGAVTASADGIVHTPGMAVDAVDTVGAGDAFCGALAVGLAARQDLDEVLRVAAVAGGLAVTKAGAAASLPTAGAVRKYLQQGTISRS